MRLALNCTAQKYARPQFRVLIVHEWPEAAGSSSAQAAHIVVLQLCRSAARAHRNMSARLPLSSGASTSVSAIASVFSPSSCAQTCLSVY